MNIPALSVISFSQAESISSESKDRLSRKRRNLTISKRSLLGKERTINNLNKLMSFLPSSSLLVDHITRYARSSRLEYNKKSY